MRTRFSSICLAFVALLVADSSAQAGLLSGSIAVPARADQMIRLFPGSPLNPGADVVEVPTSAVGQFDLKWANQQPGDDFATITSFSAHFTSDPGDPLGLYTIDAPAPPPGDSFRGRLTEIVESAGTLVSAKLTIETTFGVTLAALGGATVFTINDPNSGKPEDHYSVFIGNLDADPTAGEIFDSPANKNIYADIPGVGQVAVGQSFNRQVIVIPEPSSAVLLMIGVCGFVSRHRRRANSTAFEKRPYTT
ncbi:MAG: PEP-CTERM sorting domain-containing protein [Pirellulales bacterium]